jgi:hypothetical protein
MSFIKDYRSTPMKAKRERFRQMISQIFSPHNFYVFIHTSVLTAFIFMFYNNSYLRKYDKRTPYIIGYILSALTYSIVSIVGISVLNIVFTFAVINVPAFLLYDFKKKTGIFYNILCLLCLFCSDLLVTLIKSYANNQSISSFVDGQNSDIIFYTINLLITFLLIRLLIGFTSFNDRRQSIRTSDLAVLFLITVFEFISIFFTITRSTEASDAKMLILILIGFIVTNIVLTYQFSRISKLNYEKSKMQLIEAQNKIQLAHIEDTINKYEDSRKTIHDMRKHLSVIENLIDYEPEVLQDYVKHFNDNIKNLAGEFVCTNRVLSVIMDMKINQAKISGIDVHMNFEDVPFDFIADIDITAIFSNLWDNAIEGALSIKDVKKYINVTVGYEGPIILIVFENNFRHRINEENGKYLTSKGGKHEGLGLQIIKLAVENYGGHLIINPQDSIFNASITFNK